MKNYMNVLKKKEILKFIFSFFFFLFTALNLFAAGEIVNLERNTETINYENGEYVEYILELENNTNVKQENLTLKDNFFSSSGIEDISIELMESKGDDTSINTSGELTTGISGIVLGYTAEEKDVNDIITTPEQHGYIKLKIKGKVKDNFDENIISHGELLRTADISEITEDSLLSRVIYDYDVTLRSTTSTYAPGDVITYKLRLKNNSPIDTIRGLKVTDNSVNMLTTILNSDGTLEQTNPFDYSNIIISAVVSGIGSSFGEYPTSATQGESIENIVLGPDGIVEYTITISTKERAVGEIGSVGTIGEQLVKVYETLRDDNEMLVDATNKLSPETSNITITKEKTNTSKYLPGDEIEYNITIANSGEGYAYGYNLSDDISVITTDLANDSAGPISSSTDITSGNAFVLGNIILTEKGDNSMSSSYTVGISQSTLNLDDDVYIGPGESLVYNVRAQTDKSAIGEIENFATLNKDGDNNTSSVVTISPEDLNVSDVTIEKTVGVTEYQPDTDVIYTINVKNNATDKFVNNYNIIDNISSILTTQADGTQGQAFSSWTLNVISPTTSTNGTKVGTEITGSETTDNINLIIDMAPGEEIIYELVAHISTTSVGDIIDNTSTGADNVIESGNGIKSYPSQLDISKTVDKTEYSPNEVLTYNIIIENEGKGYDVDVNIQDLLSTIKDESGTGENNAFKSWSITSSFEGIGTDITPSADSGLATEPLEDEDLNTTARIGASTRLIYTIEATVNGEAFGKIINEANINGELYSDKGCFPIDPDINVSISSDYPSYPKTGEDLESPFDITYTVRISNDSDAGFAKDVEIKDILSDVSTTALNGDQIDDLFESWDISTSVYGDGTVLTSNNTNNYPLIGGTTNIDDTANITAGGYVEYIIKGKVKRDPSNNIIPYEDIVNTVTVIPKDKNGDSVSPITSSYTTSKKLPALRIEKSTSNLSYTLGGTVEYLLTIENIGEGYADNATISDELSNNFSERTITKIIPGTFVGTDADVGNNISNYSNDSNDFNIDGTIDIAPKETITYKIIGKVRSDLLGDTITNTGILTDTQRGNTYKASAKLILADPTGMYITKNASQYSYSPGGEINYTVTLYNTTSGVLDFSLLDYKFIDKFSSINSNLANNKGGTIADTTGSPFKKLFVSVNGGSETEITNVEEDYVHQPTLLGGAVELGGLIKPSEYTYEFRGILKDRVLSGEIKNEAVIEKTDGTQIAITSHEIDGSNSGSYTREVDKSKYMPGEELTYTFTAKGNSGYLNNYNVNEDVKNIEVDLLNSTAKGNPFSTDDGDPQFTVERYVNGVLDGVTQSPGTVTSPVSDNENIVQTIDVSPDDTIIYKVKGTIRKDIVGKIDFNGLVTEPYRHNLSIKTTVEEGGYIPGEEITLKTTIENNSDGNAGNITLEELISDLKIELSNGQEEDLFPNGWTITVEKSGDNSSYISEGTFTDSSDINTEIGIPIGGKLVYRITGIVNELAVGSTVNEVTVDGDRVSANVQSLSPNLVVKKEVVSYYRNNETDEVSGGYVPNGWIKYRITINNIGDGIANDTNVSDALASIQTTAYNDAGETEEINAFSEWKIIDYEKTGNENQSDINLTSGTEALGSASLEWTMDVPSRGSITVNILAHVSEGAIGDIKNTVTVGSKNYSSETSKSLPGEAVLTKKAYEEDGITTKSRYISGEKIIYKVTVENTGDGIISGTILDEISKITSLVEETGTNGNNPREASFSNFTVTASKTISDSDTITKVGSFELQGTKTDVDINDVLVIAPGATVEFEISGTTKENIMGNIVNVVTFGNISRSVTVREELPNISLDKRVTKVGDTTISDGTDPINYDPGDIIEYLITITNTGYGHKNNLTLTENIDQIQAKIAGNTLSEAFESYTFEVLDTGNSYVRQVGLTTIMDMDPATAETPEVVTIKVTAKLKENVIGEIDENIVTYNNTVATSEKLQQKTPEITYYKSFTDSSQNEISSKENFAPEETIFYKLVIKNTGEGYANDLSVIDKIYDLKTSHNDKAFKDGEVTVTTKINDGTSTTEGTNDGKTYVVGDVSGSSLINTTIDLAPNSTVEFYIAGKTTAYAIGSITNKILVTGEGDPTVESEKSDSVTTASIPSDIVGRKIAGTDSNNTEVYYTPGGDISYKLTFENNGEGPGTISVKDIVSNLKVTGPGGTEINAFEGAYKFVLEAESGEVYYQSDSTDILTSPQTIDGDLDKSLRLGGNSSCSFTLTGTANVKAVGSIKNIATYQVTTETGNDIINISDTIEPTPGVVEITNVADVDSYTPGEEVTYTLTIKNTGQGYAHNVNVEDLLSTMTGETSGDGSLGTVFKTGTISHISTEFIDGNNQSSLNSTVLGTPNTENGYQGNFDIYPGDSVVLKVKGTVNDNILGEITNDPIVTYDGNQLKAPVSLETVLPELNITTKISTDGSTYLETPVNYIPGEKLYYEVTLSNIGEGWDNDMNLKNIINEIKAIASDGSESLAFDESSIIVTLIQGDNVIVGTSAHNIDATIDIAPGEDIIFKIEGVVNPNIVGEIVLDSKYENSNGDTSNGTSNEVAATQKIAEVSIEEKIKNPNTGVFDLDSSNYIPGEDVTFKVFIENTEDTFAQNIDINNLLTSMEVTLADGTSGEAFTEWSIIKEGPSKSESILTNTLVDGSDLNSIGNLAPKDEYAFIITALVNENAVGEIENKSLLTVDGTVKDPSNTITFTPNENEIEMVKSTENTTYYPNGQMVYKVVIENTGNSIVDDIVFEDEVNNIQVLLGDGNNGDPFISSTVAGEVVASGTTLTTTNPNVSVDSTTGKVTSTSFDIGIGEKITFQIEGTVNNNVVGDIKNIGKYTVDSGTPVNSNQIITKSEEANIVVKKEALVDEELNGYIPGGKIKYKITIENTGNGFGDNINIVDNISGIIVETVNGNEPAFSPKDWEWTKEIEALPNFIPDLTSLNNQDLNINVDIESGKTLMLYVEGTVNPDAYGDITNTVTSYNGTKTSSSSATFIPSRSEVVMTHTVDKDVYVPGDYLTYTVTLENIGPGPAKNVNFEDNLRDILVETTNNDEAAFDLSSIKIVSTDIDTGVTESTPLYIDNGVLKSIIEKMPKNGKVTYVFKGKVRDDAVGDIINDAEFYYIDNDGTYKSDNIRVETKPTNAEITIEKEVDTEEYIAGEDLTYTVTLENEGTGNAKNIELTDMLSEIQAEYVDGTTGDVFDSWKITHIITKNSTLVTDVTNVSSYDEAADLNALVIDMAPGDKIEFTIVATTNAKVKEGAINTASFEYVNNDGTLEQGEAKTKESLPFKLLLTKVALKKEVQQGEFVEYEIIVRNIGETYFVNSFVEDKIPSGFEYVQGTTEMTRSGSDGTFDTTDDILVTGEPVVERTVNFSKVNLAPGESLRIRYLLKVSIGTTFGQYKNTAYAVIDKFLASNEDSAIVTVVPDELFDTATIIGKVFEDINGDGYQGLATAENIKIKGGVTKDYIPNSLTVEKNNVKLKLNKETTSLVNGLIVDKLNGISKNKVIEKNDKLTLRFLSKSKDWSNMEISTKAGTNILIDKFGNIKTTYTKDKKKGISQENLHVTRNTYKSKKKNIYLHEVKIENIGVYEEGIPGVRLIVLDGVVVETDEFGRYHVPDKWVLDKKGENFLVKVDKLSIPKGMEIITENPLVRRISPNGLNKFNFSLKEKEVK